MKDSANKVRFCEYCPMRGKACGDLGRIASNELVQMQKEREVGTIGTFGVIIDEDGMTSQPMRMPSKNLLSDSTEAILSEIDRCEGPVTIKRRILPDKVVCQGVGHRSISSLSPNIKSFIQQSL